MEKLHITLIAGTTRTNRKTIFAAEMVKDVLTTHQELDVELVDLVDFFPLPGEGNDENSKHPKWVKINQKSDGYVIVAPEYNHGYPGSLKMLLDNDLGNYTHKPVMVVGVSSGMLGGARMVENLLPVLRELGMVALSSQVFFAHIQKLFDQDGSVIDEGGADKQKTRIDRAASELIWMAKTLKWGRENLEKP